MAERRSEALPPSARGDGRRVGGHEHPGQPDEEVVYNCATELLETTRVNDDTFDAAKRLPGERGVVDLVNVMGWYGVVSMLLNVDEYPMP